MSRLPEHLLSRKPFITLGAAILCSVAIASSFGAVLYVALHGKNARIDNCKGVLQLRDTVANVLIDANKYSRTDEAHQFYHRNIIKLQKVECNA